jgi:hypothetical protein
MGSLEERARQAAQEQAELERARGRKYEKLLEPVRARTQAPIPESERMKAEFLGRLRDWSTELEIAIYSLGEVDYARGHYEKPYDTGQGRNDSSESPPFIPAVATATFSSDGLEFIASLTEDKFAVQLRHDGYPVHIKGRPIPIRSLADLGWALEALEDLRSSQPPRRWWQFRR